MTDALYFICNFDEVVRRGESCLPQKEKKKDLLYDWGVGCIIPSFLDGRDIASFRNKKGHVVKNEQ